MFLSPLTLFYLSWYLIYYHVLLLEWIPLFLYPAFCLEQQTTWVVNLPTLALFASHSYILNMELLPRYGQCLDTCAQFCVSTKYQQSHSIAMLPWGNLSHRRPSYVCAIDPNGFIIYVCAKALAHSIYLLYTLDFCIAKLFGSLAKKVNKLLIKKIFLLNS